MTTGARIRGQLNTGAVHMHDQQMLPLRFLLEGTAPNLYQLQMQMLCISLWMVVLETRHLGTAAVGSWNTLVTESLDAAEAINPDLPLPDTYYDAFMNVNSIDRKCPLRTGYPAPKSQMEAALVTCCVRGVMHSMSSSLTNDPVLRHMSVTCKYIYWLGFSGPHWM